MLDLLVFTQHPLSYAPNRLISEAELLGLNVNVLSYDGVDTDNLPEARFVILREPDYKKNIYDLRDKILNFYVSKNTKVLNSESYLKWSVLDKITQTTEFEKAKIPNIKLLKLEDTKYPFIVKNKMGSHGDSVYKINCKEDLDTVLLKHKLEDLLIQEFQESGFDLRVIVLSNRVLGIMKRTPKAGDFLSNFSQGGGIEVYKGNDIDEINSVALNTAKLFKLEYVGVDLMKGNDGEWKVLEVNRACQFKGFEQATGTNVASELINYLTH